MKSKKYKKIYAKRGFLKSRATQSLKPLQLLHFLMLLCNCPAFLSLKLF